MKIVFWLALALVAYTYAVYPLLMLAVGRLCHRRVAARSGAASYTPRVAVIIAAYNEERHIAARIGNLLQLDYPAELLTIHVGSDGSSDRTVVIASETGANRVQVSPFIARRGKASVLNDLIATISDEIVVFTDANTEFRPDAIRELVRHFSDPRVGAVSGELRLHDPSRGDNQDSHYWRLETVLKRGESLVGGLLGANGGIYAIRRALYRALPPDTVVDDFTIVMDISALRHRTVFEPAALAFEDVPQGIDDEFRRRVRIGIGNYQAFFRHPEYLLRATWVRRFTYVSHKVLRWFTPHLLIVALIMSAGLAEQPLYAALLATQLAAYALLAGGLLLRSHVTLPRLVNAPLFVFALNVAFMVGFWRYIRGDYAGHWRRTERT